MTRRARPWRHVGADGATGTWAVLNHEGLPDLLADLLEHRSGDDVAGDAGWDRHHHRDAAGRPILGRRLVKGSERECRSKDNRSSNFHNDFIQKANGD